MPFCGIVVIPFARRTSAVSPRGDQPEALSPKSFPDFASYTIAKRSPPTPSFMGATSPIIAFVATAASIALPPSSSMRAPTCDASTLSDATTPAVELTMERDCERSCASADVASVTRITPVERAAISARRLKTRKGFITCRSSGHAPQPPDRLSPPPAQHAWFPWARRAYRCARRIP